MVIRELVAVLEGMDQERTVISTVEPGKKIRGVGTVEVDNEPVAVIR